MLDVDAGNKSDCETLLNFIKFLNFFLMFVQFFSRRATFVIAKTKVF